MLRLRIKNVTKPVLPPQKIEVRGSGQPTRKTIEATPQPQQPKS
jgi:hypothetical protein